MEEQDVQSDEVQDKDRGNIADLERQLASNLTITDGKSINHDSLDIAELMKEDGDLSIVFDSRWNSSALNLYDSAFEYKEAPDAVADTGNSATMVKVLETLLQNQEKENEELKMKIRELENRSEESGQSFYAENRTVETITTVSVVQANQNKGNELVVGHNNLTFEEVLRTLHSQENLIVNLKKQCSSRQSEMSQAEVKLVSIREENQQLKNTLANLQKESGGLKSNYEALQKENNEINEELRSCKQSVACLNEEKSRLMLNAEAKNSQLTETLVKCWKSIGDGNERIKQLNDEAKNLRAENRTNLKNVKIISDEKIALIAKNAELEKVLQEKSTRYETELGKLTTDLADKERVIRETEDVWDDLTMRMQELVKKYPRDNLKLKRSALEPIFGYFNLTDVQMVKDVDIYRTDASVNDSNDNDSVVEVYISNPARRTNRNYRSRNRDVRSQSRASDASNDSGSRGNRRRRRSRSRSWSRGARSRSTKRHQKPCRVKHRGRSRSRRKPSRSPPRASGRWSRSGSSFSTRRRRSSRSSWGERCNSPVLVNRRVLVRPHGDGIEASSSIPDNNRSPNDNIDGSSPLMFNMPPTQDKSSPEGFNWAMLSQQFKTGSISGLSMTNTGVFSMSPMVYSKEGNRISTVVDGNATIPLLLNVGKQNSANEASPNGFIQKYTISVQKDVPGYHHGKHPVKELDDQCLKRGWARPKYKKGSRIVESKLHHFCDVEVNGKWYCPEYGSTSPRDAQFLAAMHCLQTLKITI